LLSDEQFKKSLAIGVAGEDMVYEYLIQNHGLVEDCRSQTHGEGSGPRMIGTEGFIVQPDFCVYNKPGSPKGRFAVDVKVKNSVYWYKGKQCFTVDSKFEGYKRIVQIKQLDFLQIIFVYKNQMYFYRDSDLFGKELKSNEYGTGVVYYFEMDESRIKW